MKLAQLVEERKQEIWNNPPLLKVKLDKQR